MNGKNLLTVSASPHLRHEDSTRIIMSDVIIALIPALVWAAYIFGARTLILTAVSVISCVIFETLYVVLIKKGILRRFGKVIPAEAPDMPTDLTAVVTGMLLAYTLPPAAPLWMPVLGGFIAVVIAKHIGRGLLNPALCARVILGLFPSAGRYTLPFEQLELFGPTSGIPAAQTTVESLSNGVIPQINVLDMFIGNRVGAIGEVSALLLLAGGLYLLVRRVISPHIPLSYLVAVAAVAYIFPMNTFREEFILFHLLSGGVILGAVFLANDSRSSPLTASGKVIFGAGCGLITMLVRYVCGFEGVAYAVLIMNVLTPVIDKFTIPRPFGAPKKKAVPKVKDGNGAEDKREDRSES